jgi:hypothetical protein
MRSSARTGWRGGDSTIMALSPEAQLVIENSFEPPATIYRVQELPTA